VQPTPCSGPLAGGTIGNFYASCCGIEIQVPISAVSGKMSTTISPSPPTDAVTYVPSRDTEPSSNANTTQGTHVKTSPMPIKPTTFKSQLQAFTPHAYNATVNIGTIKSSTEPNSNVDDTQGALTKTSQSTLIPTSPKRPPLHFKPPVHNITVDNGTITRTSHPKPNDIITTTSYRNHSQVEPANNQETAVSWFSFLLCSQAYNLITELRHI